MRRLGSLVMRAADDSRVPAGAALAVDRERFSQAVTDAIAGHPLITVVREEITSIPTDSAMYPLIIATGPLTSESLSADVAALVGGEHLYFYDAVSPIVLAESLDMGKVFRASRWGRSLRGRRPGGSEDPPLRVHRLPPEATADCRSSKSADWSDPPAESESPQPTRRRVRCRRWRRRLLELSTDRGGIRQVLRGADHCRVRDGARPRQGKVLRGVPAHRGHGAPGARHAALRSDEAGGSGRSADRPRAIRGSSTSAGQPCRRSLQPRRLSDAVEMGRAGTGAQADSRDSSRRSSCGSAWSTGTPTSTGRACCARRGRRGCGRICCSRVRSRASKATSSPRRQDSSRAGRRRRSSAEKNRAFRRGRPPSARSPTTSRTPIPAAINRRTSPLASCRRPMPRHMAGA